MDNEETKTGQQSIENQEEIVDDRSLYETVNDLLPKQSEDELRRLAFSDELTGLNNRRFLRSYAPIYISEARKQGSTLCMAMMDMDGFKQVNDTYGHLAGDTLLINFAKLASEHLRGKGIVIRYAGDEFVALLLDQTKKQATANMQDLLEMFAETPIDIGQGKSLTIKISVGIASYPKDADEYETLFKRADEALYTAKEGGKAQVVEYSDMGRLVAAKNISTLFPVEHIVGFDEQFTELKLHSIEKIRGENAGIEIPIVRSKRGGGKTRILKELRKVANNQAFGVISATGIAGNQTPYYSLLTAFSDTLRRNPEVLRELAKELDYPQKKELTKYIPELSQIKNPPKEKTQQDRNTIIFTALNKLLFGLIRKKRYVLLIDDAQWIDEPSLKFIDSFLTEFPESTLDVVLSVETPEGMDLGQNMAHVLLCFNSISQIGEIITINLPKLQVTDIKKIVFQITEKIDLPDEFSEIIIDLSDGNPLFVEEILKLLIERDDIFYNGMVWKANPIEKEDLPSSLEEIIQERAMILTDVDKEILKRAATMGDNFDVKVLAKILDKDEQEILDVLERARKVNLISENLDGVADYSFNTTESRMMFYDMMEDEERKAVHLEVAEAEEDIYEDRAEEIFGPLAYHFQQAEQWDRAAQLFAAASERALQARIPESARRMLQRKAYMEDMKKEGILTREQMAYAVKTFRAVRLAVRAFQLYPRENENVKKSMDKAFNMISSFFDSTDALTYSFTPDTMLVNGRQPSPEDINKQHCREFFDLMDPFGLQGIIFIKGLTEEEFADFLEVFKAKPDEVVDNWDKVIEMFGLVHIKPDRKVYVAISERRMIMGDESAVETDFSQYESQETDIDKKEINKIEDLLNKFQEESQSLKEALESGYVSGAKIDKLMELLDGVSGYLPEREEFEEEKTEEDDTKEEKEQKKKAPSVSGGFDFGGYTFELDQFSPIEQWVEDLNNDDKEVRARAAKSLLNTGDEAITPCIRGIITAKSPKQRSLLAKILDKIGPEGIRAYADALLSPLPSTDLVSLIAVASLFMDVPAVQSRLIKLAASRDPEIRASVLTVLTSGPPELRIKAVEEGMKSKDINVLASALRSVGVFGINSMAPDLVDYLDRDSLFSQRTNEVITISAIRSLGDLADPDTVENLIDVVNGGSIFKFKKGFSEQVKVAAIKALGKIGSPEAREFISRIADSRDTQLKSVAGSILRKMKR